MFNEISSNKLQNENKTIIWLDDFGSFRITTASGEFEQTNSFEIAVEVAKVLEQR